MMSIKAMNGSGKTRNENGESTHRPVIANVTAAMVTALLRDVGFELTVVNASDWCAVEVAR